MICFIKVDEGKIKGVYRVDRRDEKHPSPETRADEPKIMDRVAVIIRKRRMCHCYSSKLPRSNKRVEDFGE